MIDFGFSDDEIYRMRAYLAKRWRQSIAQVTDAEAVAYLRIEAELAAELAERDDIVNRPE